MTRLVTQLMEGASPTADGFTAFFADARGSYVTSPFKEGAHSLMIDAAALTRKEEQQPVTNALADALYVSVYVQTPAFPVGSPVRFISWADAGLGLVITETGTIRLETGGGGVLFTTSAVTTGAWYRLEWTSVISTGAIDQAQLDLFVDDASTPASTSGLLTAQTISDVAAGNLVVGASTSGHTSPFTMYFDRLLVNNGVGSAPDNAMPAAFAVSSVAAPRNSVLKTQAVQTAATW